MQLCNNSDKGRSVLLSALESSPQIKQLWEAAVQYEESCGVEGLVERVLPLYERAITEQVSVWCMCACVLAIYSLQPSQQL